MSGDVITTALLILVAPLWLGLVVAAYVMVWSLVKDAVSDYWRQRRRKE